MKRKNILRHFELNVCKYSRLNLIPFKVSFTISYVLITNYSRKHLKAGFTKTYIDILKFAHNIFLLCGQRRREGKKKTFNPRQISQI